MAQRYLIVRRVNSQDVFMPTYSELLSKYDFIYYMLYTPERILPFRPSYGIKQDFNNLTELKNHIASKVGAQGASAEIYRHNNMNVLTITIGGNVVAEIIDEGA